jgi:hypothetical protein
LPWLDALWMLGVFALSIRTVGGWLLIQRLRATALQQVPPQVAASFIRISHRIGVRGRVALRLSTRIVSPLAIGMFRSIILLPASALTTLTPEQLEAVLAHELAHIRRADYLWNILQTMIETLFFFHPAVWWIGTNLRQQRELCCDDIALASCADPVTYATALLLLEEHRANFLASHTHSHGLALALDGHQTRFSLRSRIARILGDPIGNQQGESVQATTSTHTIAPFSILGVCAALALFALPLPQLVASLRPTPQTAARPPQPAPAEPQPAPAEPQPVVAPVTPPAPAEPSRPVPAVHVRPVLAQTPQAPVVQAPVVKPECPVLPASVHVGPIHIAPMAAIAPILPPAIPAPVAVPARPAIVSTNVWARDFAHDFTHIQTALAMAQTAIANATATANANATATAAAPATVKSDYIQQMRAAGYDTDLDQYIALKMQGVTPEFAKSMADLGYGKPNAGELLALKIHGITPDYVKQLQQAGIKPGKLQDVVSYRIFNVTPEYMAAMKAAGFGDIPTNKLIELRVQNITPELARAAKQQFPEVTVNELVQLRIFNIDEAFIAKAKGLGLNPLTIEKLVQLRVSGLIEDDAYNRGDRLNRDTDRDAVKARRKDKVREKDKSPTQPE